MTPIERQILENQKTMFSVLTAIYVGNRETNEGVIVPAMNKCYWDTLELLEPKTNDESACDMSDLDEMDAKEDAFEEIGEKWVN